MINDHFGLLCWEIPVRPQLFTFRRPSVRSPHFSSSPSFLFLSFSSFFFLSSLGVNSGARKRHKRVLLRGRRSERQIRTCPSLWDTFLSHFFAWFLKEIRNGKESESKNKGTGKGERKVFFFFFQTPKQQSSSIKEPSSLLAYLSKAPFLLHPPLCLGPNASVWTHLSCWVGFLNSEGRLTF